MNTRKHPHRCWPMQLLSLASVVSCLAVASLARADIFCWDNGQVIPGTEGITPGPGVVLDHHELAFAALFELNLTGARFDFSTLTNANLTGAVVTGASFGETTSRGFSKEQLASTASYQTKNLQGILLWSNNLTGWDFSGQNLTNADLHYSTLTNADLTGAVVMGASFEETTSRGFTQAQLASTASYQTKNLQRIELPYNDLTGWDFSGQDLAGTKFHSSRLTNANFAETVVAGADFLGTTSRGFTKDQLYSTASYQQTNLRGIRLHLNDLTDWDFSGQDLTGAHLDASTLTNADLSRANLANAYLTGANLTNADLSGADLTDANLGGNFLIGSATLTNANLAGAIVTGASLHSTPSFTREQLYSTASYQQRNLRGIGLAGNDLTGWDFSGQDLSGASLGPTLTNANFSFADLRGAVLSEPIQLARNTIREFGAINGLNLQAGEKLVAYAGVTIPVRISVGFLIAPDATFDLTDNAAILDYEGTSTASAVREHITSGRGGSGPGGEWTGPGITSSTVAKANQAQPDARSLGYADNATLPLGAYARFHGAAVNEAAVLIAFTRTGDANLDGVVNDDDVTIIGATYSPGVPQPSWALGDFDYNGFVDDDDVTLLGVFYDPSAPPLAAPIPATSTAVTAIPEPSSASLAAIVVAFAAVLTFAAHLRSSR